MRLIKYLQKKDTKKFCVFLTNNGCFECNYMLRLVLYKRSREVHEKNMSGKHVSYTGSYELPIISKCRKANKRTENNEID